MPTLVHGNRTTSVLIDSARSAVLRDGEFIIAMESMSKITPEILKAVLRTRFRSQFPKAP